MASLRLAQLFSFVLLMTACEKESDNYNSRITVLNAVPNSTGFTFQVGENIVSSDASYGTPQYYLSTPSVTDSVRWKKNQSIKFDSAFVTDLPNGSDYTLLFYDSLGRYRSYFAKDDWQQPASSRQGYIRFFPLIINANNLAITNDTNRIIIGSQAFGRFSQNGVRFNAVDTFHTKLKLYNDGVLLDSIADVSILPGKSYTIYAIGVMKNSGTRKPRMILQQHE